MWIGSDGQPMASRLVTTDAGRAFAVVSFETSNFEETHFQRVGGRRVLQRRERRSSGAGGGAGGGEKGDTRSVHLPQWVPG